MTDAETSGPVGPETTEAKKPGRGRGITAMVCIVVASLLLPLAGITVWVRNLVLNTDRYVSTVKPLATDPAVQQAVAVRISDSAIGLPVYSRRIPTVARCSQN